MADVEAIYSPVDTWFACRDRVLIAQRGSGAFLFMLTKRKSFWRTSGTFARKTHIPLSYVFENDPCKY